ncbi:MAG: serine hydrolase [Candidatus Saccharimonadales bacterium]
MSSLTRLACACLVIVLSGSFAARQFSNAQQSVLTSNTPSTSGPGTTKKMDEQALSREIQAILTANQRLDTSVSVTDLQTGKSYHYGETASYTAASINKLLTATLYLHQVETGKASMGQQIGASSAQVQLEKLIVDSDNVAWHAFNDILTHPALQEYAKSAGINSYNAEENTIHSDDIALLLSKLASGKLLNNANTKTLLSYMQRASMQNYVVAGTPKGALAYHKTGYLSDRFHDAVIIKKDKRSFVIVVFSKTNGAYDFSKGASVLKQLGDKTSSVFFGS